MIARLELLKPEVKADYLLNYKKLFKDMTGMEILEPFKGFDHHGRRYPSEYLQAVGRAVIFYPLETMATFADKQSTKLTDANDARFSFAIKNAATLPPHPDHINATSIGNLAYITLKHQDATVRAAAESILDVIFASEKRMADEITG